MQERLDKWRKNSLAVPSLQKIKTPQISRRNGKNDFGDVFTEEEWQEEYKKSQTRK